MKKILFASTILASLGSVAVAETGATISGYGRFGLIYDSAAEGNEESTTVHTRLRLNIDVKTETDTGVTFGGRIRLQDDNRDNETAGTGGSGTSPAQLYAAYEGLRVEVGNINSALDNDASGLFYASEMGLTASSVGDTLTDNGGAGIGSFSTGAYEWDRMGVAAFYTIGDFNIGASYIDFSQSVDNDVKEQESSIYLSYKFNNFTVAGAYMQDGLGVKDNDVGFIGVAYAINDVANVGFNWIDEGKDSDGVSDLDDSYVLYANYTIDALTLRGVISYNSTEDNSATDSYTEDFAYGIGADYDLGGATLLGTIQQTYEDETVADFGVKFNF